MLPFGVLLALEALSALLLVAADVVVPEHLSDVLTGDTCDGDNAASLSLRQLRGEFRLSDEETRDADAVEERAQMQGPNACDVSTWPDKDHGLVCGHCKVLVDRFNSHYGTCDAYCARVGRRCTGAWEEHNDNCDVKHEMVCSQHLSSSDAICECGAPLVQVPYTCGGNADGKPCRFPFLYKGVTYSECTGVNHWGSWCSTDYDYNGGWASCDCGEAPATPPAPTPAPKDDAWLERSLVADEGHSVGDHLHTDLYTCKRLCSAIPRCKSFVWTEGWGSQCHLKDRVITASDAAKHGAHAEAYRTYYLATQVACENPGHATFRECTLPRVGTCYGRARLGYGEQWSWWVPVDGTFSCSSAFFGGDPAPGQAKECVCDHGCQDVPGWTDSVGDGCEWYGVGDRCQVHGHDYENRGHTASTACCVCKGYHP